MSTEILDGLAETGQVLTGSLERLDSILVDLDREIEIQSAELREAVWQSLSWFEFNRRCWKLYGTGRTEPDK